MGAERAAQTRRLRAMRPSHLAKRATVRISLWNGPSRKTCAFESLIRLNRASSLGGPNLILSRRFGPERRYTALDSGPGPSVLASWRVRKRVRPSSLAYRSEPTRRHSHALSKQEYSSFNPTAGSVGIFAPPPASPLRSAFRPRRAYFIGAPFATSSSAHYGSLGN